MIKVSDLILAVGFLAFFMSLDAKKERNDISTTIGIEVPQISELPLDTLSREVDVYDSYADFTY